MSTQPKALTLADALEYSLEDCSGSSLPRRCQDIADEAATELRHLHHNNELLMNALWKACGDDGQVVTDTIESQGELK